MRKLIVRSQLSVTDGTTTKSYRVPDDKEPGGPERMELRALEQAVQDEAFPRGSALRVVSTWIQ